MNLAEYTRDAASTAIYPPEQGAAYTALGLVSEVGEMAELGPQSSLSDLEAELGDVLWYLAMSAKELGVETSQINSGRLTTQPAEPAETLEQAVLGLVAASGYLAGRVKKRIRDGHEAVSDEVMVTSLNNVLVQINRVADFPGLNMAHVARVNVAKLASRADRGVLAGDGDHR